MMALDRGGSAVFFTRGGRPIGSVPPPAGPVRKLPRMPGEPFGRLWNGAGWYSRVPERIEIRLREALEGKGEGGGSGESGGSGA